jgi:riboflavin kinase / FMN adenylyltransferase
VTPGVYDEMTLYDGLDDPALQRRERVLAVGAFDGVHRGHQRLLGHVCRTAADYGAESAIMTLEPIPAQVFRPAGPGGLRLTLAAERGRELARHCVASAIVARFDDHLQGLGALEFARDVLVRRLGVTVLVASKTHTFGRHAEADVQRIAEMGMELGFEVHVLPPILVEGQQVSSSQIRRRLWGGEVGEAARLLGRPYDLAGEVVSGRGVGTGLGFPTANLAPAPEKLVPGDGVYACAARLERAAGETGPWLPAAVSIGMTPTLGDGAGRLIEAHLLGGDPGELNGRTVRLLFLSRLRDQAKFPDVAALSAQIGRDVAQVRGVHAGAAAVLAEW